MWNPEVETLTRERMEALQLERLRAAGITSSDDIRSLADLRRLMDLAFLTPRL